ncbi:MAG: DUF429 domain-containing protein [Ignavibacteriaceae bacterium]|nr:DUF429 domain-containing protein [Ignavibacteriaceae bacterium]
MSRIIAGIDLSGPSNLNETVMTVAVLSGENYVLKGVHRGVDDAEIGRLLKEYYNGSGSELITGIDAPLSYNPGGGDRPGDKELRNILKGQGLQPGTIMPPTFTKMVYLTMRGISLARLLGIVLPGIKVAEVHPAGSMVLNGFDPGLVREIKRDAHAREEILLRMEEIFRFRNFHETADDHYIASLGALLAARGLAVNEIKWLKKAEPPVHPFDYLC